MLDLAWLPNHKITRHRKARYVKFRLGSARELKITIPYRFNIKNLAAIVEEHREWILRQLENLPAQTTNLPDNIEFKAVSQQWRVNYLKTNARLKLIERPHFEVVLFGDTSDKKTCLQLIKRWIKTKAKYHLTHLLEEVSLTNKLPYEKLTVRSQKTLWGSCTSKKAISLNYKLLLLPSSLARAVFIHELCHTVYLDHSIHFWNLVASFDPDWRQHRRELKKADHFLPAWL